MALLIKSQRYIVVCEARLIGSCLNLSYCWISSISQSNGRVEKWRTCWYLPFSVQFCLFTTTNHGFKNYATLQLKRNFQAHVSTFPLSCHVSEHWLKMVWRPVKLLFSKVLKFNVTFINGVYFICFFVLLQSFVTQFPHWMSRAQSHLAMRPLCLPPQQFVWFM